MASIHRILATSPRRELFDALQREVSRGRNWEIFGPVNLREPGHLQAACGAVEVAVIEAEDMIWLAQNRPDEMRASLGCVQTVVILSQAQLLDIITLPVPPQGFLLRPIAGQEPVGLLPLALEGYFASPDLLLSRLRGNRLRLDIVAMFGAEELRILACLGCGLSNRVIAETTGLAESRVKTLVYILTRKLRMNNRTAIAVFAATNGLSGVPVRTEDGEG